MSLVEETKLLPEHIRIDIENRAAVLGSEFVRSARAELMEPAARKRRVLPKDLAPAREPCQGLDVRILFAVLREIEAGEKLVTLARVHVKTTRELVLSRPIREDAAVVLK